MHTTAFGCFAGQFKQFVVCYHVEVCREADGCGKSYHC